ncbi:MAG: hypothetical protein ABSF94_08360 [Steroidobacteraceae bacterium]|jgi:hypothetical protein
MAGRRALQLLIGIIRIGALRQGIDRIVRKLTHQELRRLKIIVVPPR